MSSSDNGEFWWCSANFRITHQDQHPYESADLLDEIVAAAEILETIHVSHGFHKGKAYWYAEYRVESPNRPDVLVSWAEQFACENEKLLTKVLKEGWNAYVYIGIHSKVLAIGFDLPQTPKLQELRIPIGFEFFAS